MSSSWTRLIAFGDFRVDIEVLLGETPGASQTTIIGNMSGSVHQGSGAFSVTSDIQLQSPGHSIVKSLDLDHLGVDPNKMPPDDPMLPPGKSTLKRQLGVRAFNRVFFVDTFSEFRYGMNRSFLSYSFVEGRYQVELRECCGRQADGFSCRII